MKLILRLLAALALFVATPALADKYIAVTPSGSAEMMFGDKPEAVIGLLTNKCIDSKWRVISSTATELVCEAPLNFGQSLLGQMLLGNSYSTPPRRFFRFNVATIGGVSRVQASGWMELQMAFGQVKRTDFSGPEFQNSIMNFMGAAGGRFPVGTTFPNHAALGIKGADVPAGKFVGLRITEIDAGSPAERAGLKLDDIVTRIAGKPFKSGGDYFDAAAKAAETATYKVDFIRDGKPQTTTADRWFRPAITQAVTPRNDPVVAAPMAAAPVSVADELSKLDKLRRDGVLTEDEFQAQKRKLLGQ